jgi:transcriptional regulator GlxA family with amidase domain
VRRRLNRIADWDDLAGKSHYSATNLAHGCHASLRQLERFFMGKKGESPHHWLNELRQKKALVLMQRGNAVKAVAGQMGYSQAANFSRDFKRYHSVSPSEIAPPSV